jgi:hypothetical protein
VDLIAVPSTTGFIMAIDNDEWDPNDIGQFAMPNMNTIGRSSSIVPIKTDMMATSSIDAAGVPKDYQASSISKLDKL